MTTIKEKTIIDWFEDVFWFVEEVLYKQTPLKDKVQGPGNIYNLFPGGLEEIRTVKEKWREK